MNILWKIYDFYYFSVVVISPIVLVLSDTARVVDFANAIFAIASVFALHGFVYKKAFLNKQFWLYYIPLFICWHIYYFYFMDFSREVFFNDVPGLIISIIIHIPLYVGLIKYVYREPEIFANAT